MKKSILIICIGLLAAAQVQAQYGSGDLLIGGWLNISSGSGTYTTTAGGTSTSIDLPKTMELGIGPWFGYFVSDDIAVGLGIEYSSDKTTSHDVYVTDDEDVVTMSMFTITPGARYYMHNEDMVQCYIALGIPIGFGSVTDDYSAGGTTTTTTTDLSSFGVGISPGTSITLGDHCALDFSYGFLGFMSTTSTYNGTDFNGDAYTEEVKNSSFGLTFNDGFNFGILFNF
ncbi:MAG: outer membrane beta-barrel protein [Chitinophagales bacterium]